VAPLLYEISPQSWLRFAGKRRTAVSILIDAFVRSGTDASAEVTTVAELEGEVAAALVGFPVAEMGRRQWSSMRVMLPRTPPTRWPRSIFDFLRERHVAPDPPAEAFYVDALVTDRRFRRRGVARELLSVAAEAAIANGHPLLALDTDPGNRPARALYERFGFSARGSSAPRRGLPGIVVYVKELTPPAP
jgi:ribosomal protein S18 acetylase RimI-like enzyme